MAVAAYAFLSLGVNVGFILLWLSITYRRRLLKAAVSDDLVERVRRQIYLGLPVYAVAIVTSIVSAFLGLAVLTGIWLFWAVSGARAMQTLMDE